VHQVLLYSIALTLSVSELAISKVKQKWLAVSLDWIETSNPTFPPEMMSVVTGNTVVSFMKLRKIQQSSTELHSISKLEVSTENVKVLSR
jgi:hypothetical protein